jgi:hypothetical protein
VGPHHAGVEPELVARDWADGPLTYAQWAVVRSPLLALYDLVSDVTRTGERSRVCRACWWDEGASCVQPS